MQLIPTTTTAVPAFQTVGGQFHGRPSRSLRRRMRTPEKLTISEWARHYRRVTEIDSDPGAWDESKLPHTVDIMNTIGQPYVREVNICMPERGGKTQILLNTMGHQVDQGSKSGNIFWLMPTEAEAKKAMADRIIPVLKATDDLGRPGRLAGYLSKYDDDTKRGTIRFNHGIRLFPAWSNSPSSMASYFGVLNIGDEIDKFETATREGSDALTLLRKRGRDDLTRSKNVYASTPGRQRKIYGLATSEAQQVKKYHLKCPDCDKLIIPDENHFDFGDDETVKNIEINDCNLSCPQCGVIINEDTRSIAYKNGQWVITKGEKIKRPSTVGYHMSAFVLPMVPLKEIAIAWIKSKSGHLPDKVAYANGYKVCDYEDDLSDRKEDSILALRDDRPAGVVHPDSDIMTIHIDTQDKGFWYTIRGWQYGPALTSWLVKAGYVPSATFTDFSGLDKLIYDDQYFDINQKEYKISYGIIDSGGHRTKEVYEWSKRTGIFASKGAKGRKAQPVTVSNQEFWPGTNKAIPGGLKLYNLDTHFHKDILADKLQIDITDAGAFVLHSGYSQLQHDSMKKHPETKLQNGLEAYARHFVAEYKDEKSMWQCSGQKRNDLWDCEQMGIALAYYLGFNRMVSADQQVQQNNKKTTNRDKKTSTARRW